MNDQKPDAKSTIKGWLRDRIDGPVVPEPEPEPLVKVRYVPPAGGPAAAEPDDQKPQDDEPEEVKRPWWSVPPGTFGHRAPAPEPEPAPAEQELAPGVYPTVNQPAPAAPPPWLALDPAAERAAKRLHQRRIWLAYHGGAAGAGWAVNLVDLMRNLLTDAASQSALATSPR
ncbi:hypothetical protein ACIOJG_22700 [Streptomyces anulatus]